MTLFIENVFVSSESGLQLLRSEGVIANSTFKSNKNALHCRLNSTIKFQGNVSFIENVQNPIGFSAIHFQDSLAYFEGHTFVYNNRLVEVNLELHNIKMVIQLFI